MGQDPRFSGATQIVTLDLGRVIDVGPLDALRDRCAPMPELWQAQQG